MIEIAAPTDYEAARGVFVEYAEWLGVLRHAGRAWPAWLLVLAGCGPAAPRLLPATDVNTWAMREGGPVNRLTSRGVRLDLPPDWIFETPDRSRRDFEHPIGKINFRDRQRTYWGSIAAGDPQDRVEDGRLVWRESPAPPVDAVTLARWHLQLGVARWVRDATIQPARVDGREAAIIAGVTDRGGTADVAIAVVPGSDSTYIVTLMSDPGLLSHSPAAAYMVFAACRLTTAYGPGERVRDGWGFRDSDLWRWRTDVVSSDDFGFGVHGEVASEYMDVYVMRTSKRSFHEHLSRWTRDGLLETKSDVYAVAGVHLGGRVLEGQGARVSIGKTIFPLTGSFYVLEEKGASYLVMIQYSRPATPQRPISQQPDAHLIDFPAVRAMLATNVILP